MNFVIVSRCPCSGGSMDRMRSLSKNAERLLFLRRHRLQRKRGTSPGQGTNGRLAEALSAVRVRRAAAEQHHLSLRRHDCRLRRMSDHDVAAPKLSELLKDLHHKFGNNIALSICDISPRVAPADVKAHAAYLLGPDGIRLQVSTSE
jgi:hypothetical protein